MSAPGPTRSSRAATRDDWGTPTALYDLLDREFRFDLDAAASPENRKCSRYLTAEEDALRADIFDRTVFCNPPYGKDMLRWISAFVWWSASGCTVVALLPANTDTEWFQLAFESANDVRFLKGRVQFARTRSSNTGGSVVMVWRPTPIPGLSEVATMDRYVLKLIAPYKTPQVGVWDWQADIKRFTQGAMM